MSSLLIFQLSTKISLYWNIAFDLVYHTIYPSLGCDSLCHNSTAIFQMNERQGKLHTKKDTTD